MKIILALILNLLLFRVIYAIYLRRKSKNIKRKIDGSISIDDLINDIPLFVKRYNITIEECNKLKFIFNRSDFFIGKFVVKVSKQINPNLYYLAISYKDVFNENVWPSIIYDFEIKYNETNDFLLKVFFDRNLIEIYTDNPCTTNETTFLVKDIADEIIKYIKDPSSKVKITDSSNDVNAFLKYVNGYLENANIKYGVNDYIGAIHEYNEAIELAPECAKAYLFRGISKEKIGDVTGAIEDYTKSVDIAPDICNAAYALRGKIKASQNDYIGAIHDFNNTLNYDPKSSGAYFNRGKAKIELKDISGAIADYTESIELNRINAYVYYFRGIAMAYIKDYNGEIDDYTKAIEINPNFAEAYLLRGLAYINIAQKESGCLDLKKAIELGNDEAKKFINLYPIN